MDILRTSVNTVFKILKARDPYANKGSYGTLSAVCGSSTFRGAAAIAVRGALRCGAGLVRLCSTEKVVAATASKTDECVFLPLPESETGSISETALPCLIDTLNKSSAALIGCGLPNCPDTRSLVHGIVSRAAVPCVLDADALNALCDAPEILKNAKAPLIITPHIGEMARLCQKSTTEIKADPEQTAIAFSRKYGCVTVLKDHKTVISSPDGISFLNDRPNGGLARGGSGDLLAGMIGAFLAQGYSAIDSAYMGVTLHSEAAARCAKRLSATSMLPSDMENDISSVFCDFGY